MIATRTGGYHGIAMKITAVEPAVLELPHPRPYRKAWSPPQALERSRTMTLVRVRSAEGVTGYGVMGGDARAAVAAVAPALLGADSAWLQAHAAAVEAAGAWAVDMALCDLLGKEAGQPLARLWGICQDRIRAYISPVVGKPDAELADDAARYREEGFTAIKLRTARPTMAEDIAMVRAVRERVGDSMDILVDANLATGVGPGSPRPAWDYARARETARELHQLGVGWLEEPLPRGDVDAIARLTGEAELAIAGGEGDRGTAAFARLLQAGAYDVLQPDCAASVPLSQMRKIAAAAELAGRRFVPHHGSCGIGLAAHLQLCATLPNSPYVEYMLDPPYRTVESYQQLHGIIPEPIGIDADGMVCVPLDPGLGIEIDESRIDRYRVA